MQTNEPIIHIVDDDPQMLSTLKMLVESVGCEARAYSAVEDFLAQKDELGRCPECLILDLCLPGVDGVNFHKKLIEEGIDIPVIIISAFGDVPTAVESMKAGAVDFMAKPFNRVDLLRQVQVALDLREKQLVKEDEKKDVVSRMGNLTNREREILERMVKGDTTKQIATTFEISIKTVAKHQVRVLSKMGVSNTVELVNLLHDVDS